MSFSALHAEGYAERTARLVPGLQHLHRMTGLLLAEGAPETADVLVLGAGGGLELKALAEMKPSWRFDGVDPSAEMLGVAEATLGPLVSRVRLHQGYIDTAPLGPFDAATCLLTLHFLSRDERLHTLQQVRRRLVPGAPFVVAHHSLPRDLAERRRWLARHAAFAAASGVPALQAQGSIVTMEERLHILSPEEDEALLQDSGFSEVEMFHMGLTVRGWVCRTT